MTKEEIINEAMEAYLKGGVSLEKVLSCVYDIAQRNIVSAGEEYHPENIEVTITTRGLEGKVWGLRNTTRRLELASASIPFGEALRYHLTALFSNYVNDMVYIAEHGAAEYELKRLHENDGVE